MVNRLPTVFTGNGPTMSTPTRSLGSLTLVFRGALGCCFPFFIMAHAEKLFYTSITVEATSTVAGSLLLFSTVPPDQTARE